uniref:Uncharacterized protein LOC113797141 n=1 Tax=Dermatophagoides pteronyssinus TaxID=6956 RepID=A0A6P6YEE3_DERPT
MSLAKVSYDFHRIKDHIPSMQLQLKYNLRIKLKYDNLYERLMFGRKICYTFGYLGNLTFRGLLMYLDSELFQWYHYDYTSAYFWQYRKILNKFFIIVSLLFIMVGLICIRTFFFHRVDTLSFQLLYDCIVYNTDQYHKTLDQVDRKLFQNQNKMRLFPHASLKCRTNILLFLFIIDWINYLAHIIVVTNTILLLQFAILLFCSLIVTFIIFHNSVKQLNENFIEILNNHRNTKISLYEKYKIYFIHRQHNRLAYYLISTNQNVWSRLFFFIAFFSIPINVTTISELIVEDIPIQTQSLFIFITILHVISVLVPFMSLAKVSDDFHQIKNQIPSLQFRLKHNQHLRLKLKYDDLYERL